MKKTKFSGRASNISFTYNTDIVDYNRGASIVFI
jgi:hypothetical protein